MKSTLLLLYMWFNKVQFREIKAKVRMMVLVFQYSPECTRCLFWLTKSYNRIKTTYKHYTHPLQFWDIGKLSCNSRGCFIPTWCKRSKHSKQQARGYSEFQLHWNFLCFIRNPDNTQSSLSTLATVLTCWLRVPWDSIQSIESLNATEIFLRASCLKLEIN